MNDPILLEVFRGAQAFFAADPLFTFVYATIAATILIALVVVSSLR